MGGYEPIETCSKATRKGREARLLLEVSAREKRELRKGCHAAGMGVKFKMHIYSIVSIALKAKEELDVSCLAFARMSHLAVERSHISCAIGSTTVYCMKRPIKEAMGY